LLINALGTRFRPVEFWKKERPAEINLGKWDKQSLGELLSEAQNIEDVGERIHFLSGQFKEARYKGGTMVGSNWELEPEILVANLQSLDCFTFVDYVHAMSKSFDYDSFIDNLKATRYGDGEVSFSKRNHYFTQWIERNNLDDITSELEGTQVTTKTINRLTFIDTLGHKTHAHYLPSLDHNGFSYLERDVWYVPQKEIKSNVLSDLKPGDFVGLYSSAESIDVEHLGIITKKPNGKTYIRHASSAAGRVIDSELVSYVNRVKLFEGIVVARAKD